MEYKGKLYGKVHKSYFPLEATTDDFETLQTNIELLKNKLQVAEKAFNQAEIVKQRLHYYFTRIDGTWDIPKDMPFMKEFLNEVKKLCDIVS